MKKYRPVSLLLISGKVLEKIIFNLLFIHLDNNDLLNSNKSIKPGDSCLHQLTLITHDIYKANPMKFDVNPSLEVTRVFLNFSKGFDKVTATRLEPRTT